MISRWVVPKWAIPLFGIACLGGCLESTPPTPVFTEIEVGVRSNPAETSLLDGDLLLDEVRLNMRRIDFVPKTESDPGVDYEGPFVIRLVQNGEVTDQEFPSLDSVSVPVDSYDLIRFRIDNLRESEVPTGLEEDEITQSFLVGNSVVMEGSFEESAGNDLDGSGGVSQVPFRFVSDMIVNLKIDLPTSLATITGETSFVFLAMNLPFWFEPVLDDLQELSSSDLTDGTVLLADSAGSGEIREIIDRIEDAIKLGARLALSTDDDQFEEDEVDEDARSEVDLD